MITAPSRYGIVYSDPLHFFETKLVVGGSRTEYDESHIISLTTSVSLFGDNLSIGNVIVNQFQATLVNVLPTDIPKMTVVEIWVRALSNVQGPSGWFPKGVFYTKKPDYDPESGVLKVEGYDMMFLAEQTPYPTGTIVSWENETMRTVAGTLATVMGIPLENANQVEEYDFPAPPYGYSAREILSQIAIANGGNWMITYAYTSDSVTPKLRLRKLMDTVSGRDLGRTVQSFTKGEPVTPITHVTLTYGINADGATMYKEAVAATDNGREIEYAIPVITDGDVVQDIATDLLRALDGFTYDPFSARGAELDPLMEVGDVAQCNSCTAKIGSIDTNFSKAMVCSISSPGIPEEDDFPYMTSSEREADREKRTSATNSARITVNADAITAEVLRATDAESDLNTNIRSTLTQTADSIRAEITEVQTDLDGHAVEQSRYIEYGPDGLKMGAEGSEAKAILTNTKLSFTSPEGDEKAYIGEDETDGIYKFFVVNGHIVNQLELGENWLLIASGSENDYRLTIKSRG